MKKIVYLLIMISILSSLALATTNVFNTTSGTVYTDVAHLQASFVNQDPSPADPGAYVNLLFKIENRGTDSAENASVELITKYPFSLDSGTNSVTQLGTINSLQSGNNAFLVRYKVRVDKDAINGDNEIKLKYYTGDSSSYNIATFNVSVSNPRTDFDVIAQDQSTLVIANIGANTAQSVIVRIPNQQNFRVNGTSASVIGNLNAGDYTLATFQILSARAPNATNLSTSSSNLDVEISYTDTLGIRRTVKKNVSFGFSEIGFGNITGRSFTRTSQILPDNGTLYIIIGVIGIVVVIVLIKIRSRKKK